MKPHDNVQLWPSFFSGIEVITNRITPLHRDPQSAPPVYDFLVSAGTHTEAFLDLPDVKARIGYKPCTVVAVCGKGEREPALLTLFGTTYTIVCSFPDQIGFQLGDIWHAWTMDSKVDKGYVQSSFLSRNQTYTVFFFL